jgi:uncharacterized repeat protein (TIGR03803 family)
MRSFARRVLSGVGWFDIEHKCAYTSHMTNRLPALTSGGALCLVLLTFTSYGTSQTLTTLYSFTGGSNGEVPLGNLAFADGANGPVLYGATFSGTSNVVFSLTSPASPGESWTYAVLDTFTYGSTEGFMPAGGVALGSGGALYGTTKFGGGGGGTACGPEYGCGSVFSLTPPASPGGAWTQALLYGFSGDPGDGYFPVAGVVAGDGGVLYGTTSLGGTRCSGDCGTVFSLTPPTSPGGAWSETLLHSFGPPSQAYGPMAGVTIGSGGDLYGTTAYGGARGCGTVFTLKPPASPGGPWAEGTLYSFTCAPDGEKPVAGLEFGAGGVLYGTTNLGGTGDCPSGCGTVFALTPPASPGGAWTETVLHSFTDNNGDGAYPWAGVVIGGGGVLYGTTAEGGNSPTCCGSVFSLTPPASPGGAWTEAVLGFGGSPNGGAVPRGGLVIGSEGVLYGTTTAGGNRNNGAIFAWKP